MMDSKTAVKILKKQFVFNYEDDEISFATNDIIKLIERLVTEIESLRKKVSEQDELIRHLKGGYGLAMAQAEEKRFAELGRLALKAFNTGIASHCRTWTNWAECFDCPWLKVCQLRHELKGGDGNG